MSNKLGPLADLVGTWTNAPGANGFNLIAVPVKNPNSFQLLMHQYQETIIFKEITAGVPNRGGVDQQNVAGLTYDLVVSKAGEDPTNPANILHVENGMLLYVPDVRAQPTNLDDPTTGPVTETTHFPIVRQASIPHGNTVLAQGEEAVTSQGNFQFPLLALNPVGLPAGVLDYALSYPNNVPGEGGHQTRTTDLNRFLSDYVATNKQQFGKVVTFKMNTANQGGITNISFVQQHVTPTGFRATFWIEEVLKEGHSHLQLQYSQVTDLTFDKNVQPSTSSEFPLVVWPHGNANTLVKVSDATHHRALDAHHCHGIHFHFPHLHL